MRKSEENKNLVEKFAEGNCSHDEALKVIQGFKDPRCRIKLHQALTKLWYKKNETKEELSETVDLSSTLDRVHHRINIYREKEESGLRKRNRFNKILLRVAAVIFLPLLITTVLYVHENLNLSKEEGLYTEINVAYGSKLRTELPDGTVVWLNSGSTLKYPQSFSKRNRQAILSGEAYFDVTPDRLHPFVVKTEALDLKVLGTQLNVMAYPDENYVLTTLEKGRISIERPNAGKKISRFCFLEPGEHAVFQKKSGAIRRFMTDTDKYTSWKEGKLIFRNDPLALVIKRLERWYNTDIEIAGDKNLPETPYTMTIEDETITQVLEYLSVASPISWEIIPAHKQENGKISKTRYIISNKNFSK
ncbi:MAG: DUF4974 domain-containing protein [Bacteroidetes bacterium]|nr:DUF4974 domain-containing protein [Bacteroidota bacterium]